MGRGLNASRCCAGDVCVVLVRPSFSPCLALAAPAVFSLTDAMVFCGFIGESEPEVCRRVVLLGNVGSGKTTFCKQIVDAYLGGFSSSMNKEFRKHIQSNILHRMVALKSHPEVYSVVAESERLQNAYHLLENAAVADFEYTDENLSYVSGVLDAAIDIGSLPVLQRVVHDVFYKAPWDYSYFKSIRRIFKTSYVPSKEDIFLCRKPTTGVCEYIIRHLLVDEKKSQNGYDLKQTKEVWIEFVDVGGTNIERKRWEKILQDCDGIFYFLATTDYNEKPPGKGEEDDYFNYLNHGITSNISLEYSKDLLLTTMASRKTASLPIVLLLTKHDLFKQMLENGDIKMESFLSMPYSGSNEMGAITDFITTALKSSLKIGFSGLEQYEKVDKLPVFPINLVAKENFPMKFNRIWIGMEKAIQSMEELNVKMEESIYDNAESGGLSTLKNKFSIFRSQSNRYGSTPVKAKKMRRPSQQLFLNQTLGDKGPNSEKVSVGQLVAKPSDAKMKLLKRKTSFDSKTTYASAQELASGDNVSTRKPKTKNGKAKRLSSAIVRGIRRTKSYHWN